MSGTRFPRDDVKPVADVTLAIPMHNSQAFLDELFASIDSQPVLPREIIVFDDSSADGSLSEARRLIAGRSWSKRARVERSATNLGVAGAYNRLIALATSEWIHVLDADDVLGEGFYAGLGLASLGRSVVALAGSARCNRFLVDVVYRFFALIGPRRLPGWLPILGIFTTRSALVYRRSLASELNFPEPAFDGSDILHLLQLHGRGEVVFARKAVVRYRIHGNSATATSSSGRYLTELGRLAPGWLFYVDFFVRKRIFSYLRK